MDLMYPSEAVGEFCWFKKIGGILEFFQAYLKFSDFTNNLIWFYTLWMNLESFFKPNPYNF